MSPEVIRAHAASAREWAAQYKHDGRSGAEEVAFLLGRVARLCDAMVGDAPVPEPMPPAEESVAEPAEG